MFGNIKNTCQLQFCALYYAKFFPTILLIIRTVANICTELKLASTQLGQTPLVAIEVTLFDVASITVEISVDSMAGLGEVIALTIGVGAVVVVTESEALTKGVTRVTESL